MLRIFLSAILVVALPLTRCYVPQGCAPGFRSCSVLKGSRMPSPEDLAELDEILRGEREWENNLPDFSENKPRRKGTPPAASASVRKPQVPSPAPISIPNPIAAPNSNWRTATSASASATKAATPSKTTSVSPLAPPVKPTAVRNYMLDVSIDDLDYEDFEAAMYELENGGLTPLAATKLTTDVGPRDGLRSGATIPEDVWEKLVDAEGAKFKFSRLHKDMADVVVVFADPRRMTDEFRTVLDEFNKIPCSSLKVAVGAVNCDDQNDHRKFLKKATKPSYALLSDPTRSFMDLVKARQGKRIMSVLFLLHVPTKSVLHVWYEQDFDVFTTKATVVEAIKAYRADPRGYMERQIGIR